MRSESLFYFQINPLLIMVVEFRRQIPKEVIHYDMMGTLVALLLHWLAARQPCP
jgi:hypothetical protein